MSLPELKADLFADQAIRDPHPLYRVIRARAPAVWLPEHAVFALGRYDDVRAALRSDKVLISGGGVALNDAVNGLPSRTTLMSDGALHRQRRGVLMKPMMPRALSAVRPELDALADALVVELEERDTFDGITDFAQVLPVSVVSRLVGLPEAGREQMLDWATATFNALGPPNARAQASFSRLGEMARYASEVKSDLLALDGWAAGVFAAAREGRLDPLDAQGLLVDYIGPSLDTTILASGWLLYLLGTYPDQYDLVRANPDRIPAVVHEVLRFESPVRAFTRLARAPYEAGEVSIPAGERVLILYGAANRDERHYPAPDCFDVTREAWDHLAFGQGTHRCAGAHLAQLELEALLRALVARVRRIEVGEPEVLMSNMLRGLQKLPARFH